MFRFFAILCLISFALSGCQTKKKNDEEVLPIPLVYNSGKELLEKGEYKAAAEEFEKIYYQHPGDAITPQAELMEAYALFLDNKYEDCVDVLNVFIQLHPLNEDIDYAYYLKGLSEYMQISKAELDQSVTENAQKAFTELIARFPNTKYASDARLKMDLINDHLAGNELYVARYYMFVYNPIAAIPRLQNVIRNYDTTSHTPEALYRLTEAFMILGLKDEATKYAAVLGHNYNHSKWYSKAYEILK
ncbi:MAG: uptake lipoprotein [Pseudomonadota bacterium]|jgi:outer membrane protein assembly factor BamD